MGIAIGFVLGEVEVVWLVDDQLGRILDGFIWGDLATAQLSTFLLHHIKKADIPLHRILVSLEVRLRILNGHQGGY